MIRFTVLLLPVSLIACTSYPRPLPGPVRCDAGRVQALVGREARPGVVQRARVRAGARDVRLIRPGQPVTMDFRSDRLNIEVDHRNRIRSARCG
ncbi:I78 family peptidase inhibitor [Sphingomonas sp. BT-65]|uniref:I78 family peptidase inhibitor n=1 Tax=Sphingomonas sp. BT-65 TaxID=2989821 RepID=UPI002236B26E|nr:I78 family peptidase inhibitor [Sphingomonas sp. BT-65]MCW4460562.1 I78 family peptidase inhibitor [Sphingomonas sp. BT-65]